MRTPLYDWHVRHGGRMVDFAGWDMPVQYTSIMEEHQAVRTGAGLFDISHMGRLSLKGPGAEDLVQYAFSGNVALVKNFQVRYGLICNIDGGIHDDVLVYRWPENLGMVVNATNRAKIVSCLVAHLKGRKVTIHDRTLETGMVAVQGPGTLALCQGLFEADASKLGYYRATLTAYRGQPCAVSRTGYTGEDGLEVVVNQELAVSLWEDLVARGARPCGLGARDTLRLEAGMPLYGHELGEEIDPFQAGLGRAVQMDKGDFLGREALVRRQQEPGRRHRVGLELEGQRIAREGAAVLKEGQEVGRVTSGTFGPTLHKTIAMAYLEPRWTALGTTLEVDIRGKPAPARVVALPFYRRPGSGVL